jgi:hypothetical protein
LLFVDLPAHKRALFSVSCGHPYKLLRDHRVPIRPKLIALGIGAAVVGFVEILQLPLESVFALILPVVGVAGDIVFDGAEAVIGTSL